MNRRHCRGILIFSCHHMQLVVCMCARLWGFHLPLCNHCLFNEYVICALSHTAWFVLIQTVAHCQILRLISHVVLIFHFTFAAYSVQLTVLLLHYRPTWYTRYTHLYTHLYTDVTVYVNSLCFSDYAVCRVNFNQSHFMLPHFTTVAIHSQCVYPVTITNHHLSYLMQNSYSRLIFS